MSAESYTAHANKKKLLIAGIFLLVLCATCAYFLYQGPNPDSSRAMLRSPYIFYPVLSIGTLLFLIIGLRGLLKAMDSAPALVVNQGGINLNDDITIEWSDISHLEYYEDFTSSALNGYKIMLNDNQAFLHSKRDHPLYRRMQSTCTTTGTPIVVYTNSLVMDVEKFNATIDRYLKHPR
jgi:hypothetical protein